MATRVITVNDILDGHVGLDLECLDRIYLNGWVPNLQVPGQVIEGCVVSIRTDGALASSARSASVSRWADAVATTAVDLSIDDDLLGDELKWECAPRTVTTERVRHLTLGGSRRSSPRRFA